MCTAAYTTNTVSNMKSMYCGVWRRRGGTKSVYMYVTSAYLCVCDVGMTFLLFFFSLITTWWVQNMFYRSSLSLLSPFCSFYHLFDSTVFSLSFSSFQHLVPLWNKKKYYYYSFSSFITSLIPFLLILGMQQSSSIPFSSLLYLFFLKREVI